MNAWVLHLMVMLSCGLAACDSPQRTVQDVLGDADVLGERDVESDFIKWDVPDAPPDVEDGDVTDLESCEDPDSTEFPTDPDEHLIFCDRKLVAVQYPWAYSFLRERRQQDGYTIPYGVPYRFHLETNIEDRLANLDKMATSDGFTLINSNTEKIYTPARSLRYLTDPRVDGEYGPWILAVTDVNTGQTIEWDPGFELLSEDCLEYDLFSGVGRAVIGVWKISDDESEALFLCSGDTMDLYRMNLLTGAKTMLMRGRYEPPFMLQSVNTPLFQDTGGDLVSILLGWQNASEKEIRVWNWRTGVLLWSFVSAELSGIKSIVAEDGWLYYTMREPRDGGWYYRIDGYNVLSGETDSPPMVKENTLAPVPAVPGHPEYVFFMAGDGPITSSEPRLPICERHYYLWNRDTDVVRRVTRIPISYGVGVLATGQIPAQTAIYQREVGTYACFYSKNLIGAGIMDPLGNLLPEP